MKTSLFTLFMLVFAVRAYSMNVLITHFDPFNNVPVNYSKVMAYEVQKYLSSNATELKVTICELRTIYDKAYDEIQDCIASMSESPDMIISLGEGSYGKIQMETRSINNDKSFNYPDNEGEHRNNTAIYPGEAKSIGVTLPVEKGYCALSSDLKKWAFISKSAGSFVCNNTMYHTIRNFNIPTTFFHVPTVKYMKGEEHKRKLTEILSTMIIAFSQNLSTPTVQPANKSEVKSLLRSGNLSQCEKSFYRILKNEY